MLHSGTVARLHVVTDDRILALPDLLPRARTVLQAGGGRLALHLRGPRAGGARMYQVAQALREPAQAAGSDLLVNDRVDVALCLDLTGVHLGRRSMPAQVARRLLGPDRLVGLSVHSVDASRVATLSAADFLMVGTVFSSTSHPGRPGSGLELVAQVGGVATVPVLAIGGIIPERVRGVVQAGAHGVAVLSGIWDKADPARAVEDYLSALRT